MKNSKNYHSHHDNLPFQIYLKDHTFIPDFIYLPISNPYLQLYNSDDDENSKYTIQCYGVKEYHNMIILSNQSIIISFISLGKFELTCLENALMKCIVEVYDDHNDGNTNHEEEIQGGDWKNVTYHLNKSRHPSSLEEILHHDQLATTSYLPNADAQQVLRHQRLTWNQQKLSTSNNASESSTSMKNYMEDIEEEEKGEMLFQREKIRLKQREQVDSSNFVPYQDQVEDRCDSSSDEVDTSIMKPPVPPPAVERPKTAILLRYKEIISICDYDFNRRNIIIRVGAPIEFILDPSTPSHVEHVLEGRSVHSQLCFVSEILQLPYSGHFTFIPEIAGEIYVTCQIYNDMACRIVVINPPPPAFSTGIYDSKKKIQQHTQIFSPRLPLPAKYSQTLSGSFPVVRQSVIKGEVENSSIPPSPKNSLVSPSFPIPTSYLGVAEKSYSHSGPLSVSSSFGDANSVASSVLDSDDGPEEDLYYFATPSEVPLELEIPENNDFDRVSPPNNFTFTPHYHTESSEVLSSHPDFIVDVEDFKFRPSHLQIYVGNTVLFRSCGQASMQKLSCMGEFDGVPLDSSDNLPSSNFFHTFKTVGTFHVKNEIFSFMECEITVLSPVVQKNLQHQQEPIISDNQLLASSSPVHEDEVQKFYHHIYPLEERFRPAPLVGSFPKVLFNEKLPRDSIVSSPKALQTHLMASVDWGIEAEEFSDEDVENDPNVDPIQSQNMEQIPTSPILENVVLNSKPSDCAPTAAKKKNRKNKKKNKKKAKETTLEVVSNHEDGDADASIVETSESVKPTENPSVISEVLDSPPSVEQNSPPVSLDLTSTSTLLPQPGTPPKKENNLMNLLHSASVKKRSQDQSIPRNSIDQFLYERWKDIDSKYQIDDYDTLPTGKQIPICRLDINQ